MRGLAELGYGIKNIFNGIVAVIAGSSDYHHEHLVISVTGGQRDRHHVAIGARRALFGKWSSVKPCSSQIRGPLALVSGPSWQLNGGIEASNMFFEIILGVLSQA